MIHGVSHGISHGVGTVRLKVNFPHRVQASKSTFTAGELQGTILSSANQPRADNHPCLSPSLF